MDIYDFYDNIKEYAKNSDGYTQWRKIHGDAFGRVYLSAFEDNEDARLFLTSALTQMTKKEFLKAERMLAYLYELASNDFDRASICYFSGLNFELMQEKEKMNRCYEELRSFNIGFHYNIIFHPYYHTAKLSAKEAECTVALQYYKKALSFYDRKETDEEERKTAAHIYSDMAAVFSYRHQYSEAVSCLKKSFSFSETDIEQRDYVIAILNALENRKAEVDEILKKLSPLLRRAGSIMTQNIMNNKDPHYCTVRINRFAYPVCLKRLSGLSDEIISLVKADKYTEAAQKISDVLTAVFPFMKRKLACRIIKSDDSIIIECKNYYVKTLMAEYDYLFEAFNKMSTMVKLISVNEFERR